MILDSSFTFGWLTVLYDNRVAYGLFGRTVLEPGATPQVNLNGKIKGQRDTGRTSE